MRRLAFLGFIFLVLLVPASALTACGRTANVNAASGAQVCAPAVSGVVPTASESPTTAPATGQPAAQTPAQPGPSAPVVPPAVPPSATVAPSDPTQLQPPAATTPTATPAPAPLPLSVPALAKGFGYYTTFTVDQASTIEVAWTLPTDQEADLRLYAGNPYSGLANPLARSPESHALAQDDGKKASYHVHTGTVTAGVYSIYFFNGDDSLAATAAHMAYAPTAAGGSNGACTM